MDPRSTSISIQLIACDAVFCSSEIRFLIAVFPGLASPQDQWEGFCDLALKFSKPVSSLGPRDLQLGREVW